VTGDEQPLAGVVVVDVTSNVAGPFASLILADLGAEVIKVERPGLGDDTRHWGPPFVGDNSAINASLNRNKRSVTLDLRSEAGLGRFRELVARSDVLIQNLRPGSLAALGLGGEALCAEFPRLVYCDLTGFGGSGPLGAQAGYDPLIQAFSGMMRFNTQPGAPFSRVPVSILDKGMGMWAALGVLAALYRRTATGRGGLVETSLVETAGCWLSSQIINFLVNGDNPTPIGSRAAGIAPYQVFRTKDGEVMIAAGNDALWRRMCQAIEAPELLDRPEFKDNPSRAINVDTLEAEIEARLAHRTTEDVCQLLQRASVPVSPLNRVGDFAVNDQVTALGIVQTVTTASGGTLPTVGSAVRFGGLRPPARTAPPALGEATEHYFGRGPEGRDTDEGIDA